MSTSFKSQELNHLGLVSKMYDELGIGEVIDGAIVQDKNQRHVSVGQAVKAMVLNGLGFVNQQLYLTPHFFKNKPLERLIGKGIKPEHLNDDTLGRSLDALYQHGVTNLFSRLSSEAARCLGLKPRYIHGDITSFHVDGRYNCEQNKDTLENEIHITTGYSRDHRSDLNQAALELVVEHQAGIPVLMRPLSGNASDKKALQKSITQHIGQLQTIDGAAYAVYDSAVYSKANLQALKQQAVSWVTRVPETLKQAKDTIAWAKEQDKQPLNHDYACVPIRTTYADIPQRWLVIESKHAQKRAFKTLNRQYTRQTEQESKAFLALCRQTFACQEDAQKALNAFKKQQKFTNLHGVQYLTKQKYLTAGRPAKGQQPDKEMVQIQGQLVTDLEHREMLLWQKSCFILATNEQDSSALSDEGILQAYKGQSTAERGFRFLKDPSFLADSLFLKSPRRVMALLMVMTICLLVYSAIQYRIRQSLKENNISFPDQKGKPTQRPTAKWVFHYFVGIHVLLNEQQAIVLNLEQDHRQILTALGKQYENIYS